MRSIDTDTRDALLSRNLRFRNFLWVTPRDKDTGAQVDPVGFWNDDHDRTLDVLDGVTGGEVSREYIGGALVSCDPIILSIGLDVHTMNVGLSMLSPVVVDLVRNYELRRAPVEVHRVLFNPLTGVEIAAGRPRFLGFVNRAPIKKPKRGGITSVTLELISHARELTRINPDKRSDASQQIRHDGDHIFQYAEAMATIQLFWGLNKETPAAAAQGAAGPRSAAAEKFRRFF